MAALKVRQRSGLSQCCVGFEVESQQQLLSSSFLLEPLEPSPLSCRSTTSATIWRHRLENLLWIASAIFIIYYGDFHSNLFALLVSDSRIRRTPFNFGLACIATIIGIFLYLAFRLRAMHKTEERLEVVAPGAIPAATVIGLAAFILFSFALWPIWNVLTVPMLFTLFMAFVVISPYLPPYVNVKLETDSVHSLYIRG